MRPTCNFPRRVRRRATCPRGCSTESFDWGGTLQEVGTRAVGYVERFKIEAALKSTKWNKTRAAEQLGVSYKTLLNKIRFWVWKTKSRTGFSVLGGSRLHSPRIKSKILSFRAKRRISLCSFCLHLDRREILRFARNDNTGCFFRSLFSRDTSEQKILGFSL